MALYDYKCECGNSVEISHPMHWEPEVLCAKCTKVMRKVLFAAGVSFKGSGFYSTDKKNAG